MITPQRREALMIKLFIDISQEASASSINIEKLTPGEIFVKLMRRSIEWRSNFLTEAFVWPQSHVRLRVGYVF